MKPPPVGYSRPQSVAECLARLAELGPDAKVLAGGQSLVPLMSMRLAQPDHLIDINRLAELSFVRVGTGQVRVGALARHADVQRSEPAALAQPLLHKALRFVAHPAIRYRGTTVGSIVHADPAAEMPAVLALLGGQVRLASSGAERVVPAEEFFSGPFETATRDDELATEVSFPVLTPSTGTGFAEVSRRHGDFAICGVAAMVELDADDAIAGARAAYLSMAATPVVLDLTEAVAGTPATGMDFRDAGELARQYLDPQPDIHATAAYRRQLAAVLTERALREALGEAGRRRQATDA